MNREEILAKLEKDEALSPMESALLDAYLDEETGSETLAALKALKREDPSFAWRARLNARIATEAARRRRRKPWLTIPFAAGSATAALALATGFFFINAGSTEREFLEPDLASYLFEWHEEAAAAVILPDGGTDLGGFLNRPSKPLSDDVDDLLYGRSVVDTL